MTYHHLVKTRGDSNGTSMCDWSEPDRKFDYNRLVLKTKNPKWVVWNSIKAEKDLESVTKEENQMKNAKHINPRTYSSWKRVKHS